MEIKLDPELQALVDEEKALNPPHPVDVPLEALRAGYVQISQAQSLADVACDAVQDLTLPGPAAAIPARLYVPRGKEGKTLAGLIFIHGGGFMIGDLESHDSVCRQLANRAGIRVLALDYRLAPEHKFPAAVEDSVAGARRVLQHAADFGMDASRIAIGGDSAGGNLAAVVCQQLAKAGEPLPAFQLLIYPSTNRTHETESARQLREGVTLDARILEYFVQGYVGGTDADPTDVRLSPGLAPDLAGQPPALVVTAEYDPLRDEGKTYADQLAAAGVAVSYHCCRGLMHNFIMQTARVQAARKAVEDMGDALRAALVQS